MDAATFVRHYEDAASMIGDKKDLPLLPMAIQDLSQNMLSQKQIAYIPTADDPAWTLVDPVKRQELDQASQAIAPMFWGARKT